MKIDYRTIKASEHPFLREMFYEALFVPAGQAPYPLSILDKPGLSKYFENWGERAEDLAIVAVDCDELIAAVWGRKFFSSNKGYGYIDDHTPEISIAVRVAYRDQGVGTSLLHHIEGAYRDLGVEQLSLSVDKLNRARNLYEKVGYTFYKDCGTAITMLKIIK